MSPIELLILLVLAPFGFAGGAYLGRWVQKDNWSGPQMIEGGATLPGIKYPYEPFGDEVE